MKCHCGNSMATKKAKNTVYFLQCSLHSLLNCLLVLRLKRHANRRRRVITQSLAASVADVTTHAHLFRVRLMTHSSAWATRWRLKRAISFAWNKPPLMKPLISSYNQTMLLSVENLAALQPCKCGLLCFRHEKETGAVKSAMCWQDSCYVAKSEKNDSLVGKI